MNKSSSHFSKSILLIVAQLLAAALWMFLIPLPKEGGGLFLLNLAFYLLVFILPLLLYIALFLKEKPFVFLGLVKQWRSGCLIGLLISAFIVLVFLFKNRFQISYENFSHLWPWAALGTVLAAPLEEIPFRGFYQKILKERWGFWKANLLVSFFFALLHIGGLGTGAWIQLFMLMGIGLWLGYIYEKTHSLWAVVLVHAAYNFMIVLF